VEAGKKKVIGQATLTLGEISFTLLGVAVIVYGEKIPFLGKFLGSEKARLVVGVLIIVVGEWVW
jgi:rRNA processing protein Krr1/Pno1